MSTQNNLFYIKLNKKKKMSPNKKEKAEEQLSNSSSDSEDSDQENDEAMQGNGIDSMMKIEIDEQPYIQETSVWSTDDDHELVRKLKVYVKPKDRVNYKTRIRQIPWKDVAFGNHTAHDCRCRFEEHLKSVRHYRNLEEIVDDVKGKLKKSLTSYQLFVQDQLNSVKSSGDFDETIKNLETLYNLLSPEQRAMYEQKAKGLQINSRSNPIQSKAANAPKTALGQNKTSLKPKTPFILFTEHVASLGGETDKKALRETYENMSMDEKYKWIIQSVHLAPMANIADFLNKEERRIFQGKYKGCPTGFSLYSKHMIPKLKDKYDGKSVLKEIGRRWKLMDENEQKPYIEAARVEKDRIDEEQRVFNEKHGFSLRKSKKRKSSATVLEPDSHKEPNVESSNMSPRKKFKVEELSPIPTYLTSTPIDSMLTMKSDNNKKDRIEYSTTPTSEKKSKKHRKSKEHLPPPEEKLSWIEYIAKKLQKKVKKAAKAYEKLEKKERKQIRAEFRNYIENYESQLVAYLDSLPREEADDYLKQVKANAVDKADDDQEHSMHLNYSVDSSS